MSRAPPSFVSRPSCRSTAGDRDLAPTYPRHQRFADARATGTRRSRSTCAAFARVDEDYWEQYRTTPKAFIAARGRAAAVAIALRRAHVDSRVAPPDAALDRRASAQVSRAAARRARSAGDRAGRARRARAKGSRPRAAPPTSASTSSTSASSSSSRRCCSRRSFFKLGVEQRVREVGLLRAVGFGPARGPPPVPARRARARGRSEARSASLGARRLRVAADGRAANVVGGRRRHDGADAARHARLARRRRGRRRRCRASAASGGRCAASPASRSAACWPGTSRRVRIPIRPTSRHDAAREAGLLADRRRLRRCSAIGAARRRRAGRRRRRVPARSSAPARRCWSRRCACSPRCSGAGRRARSTATAGGRSRASGSATPRYRPGRSVLSMAVIASATFILISVDAFRRDDAAMPAIRDPAPAATSCWSNRCCRSSTTRTRRRTRRAEPVRPR